VIRTPTAGQWIVNINLYARHQGVAPIRVAVSLWDLRSTDHVVYSDTRQLTRTGDERTMFRFSLDEHGNVAGISHVPISLVSPRTSFSG
jgi:hypothetical protein